MRKALTLYNSLIKLIRDDMGESIMAEANSSIYREFLRIVRKAFKRAETRAETERNFEKSFKDTATGRRGPDQKREAK